MDRGKNIFMGDCSSHASNSNDATQSLIIHSLDQVPNGNPRSFTPTRSSILGKLLPWCKTSLGFLLVLSVMVIVAILAMPLLLIFLLITRLLQFIRHDGHDNNNAILLKLNVLTFVYVDLVLAIVGWLIFFVITGYFTCLEDLLHSGSATAIRICRVSIITTVVIYFVYFSCYALVLFGHELLIRIRWVKYQSDMEVPDATAEALFCIIFPKILLFPDVLKFLPILKKSQILGLQTTKWIEVWLFTLFGYNCIRIITRVLVWLIWVGCQEFEKESIFATILKWLLLQKKLPRSNNYLVYWAYGLKRSTTFIFSSVLLLLIWVLFFGSHLKGTPRSVSLVKFGTMTCVSLLICSILWLMKTCVVLKWEGLAVYDRLSSRIVERRKQLYFLGILGHHKQDVFEIRHQPNNSPPRFLKNNIIVVMIRKMRKCMWGRQNGDRYRRGPKAQRNGGLDHHHHHQSVERWEIDRKWEKVEDELLMKKELVERANNLCRSIHNIKKVAQYFLKAHKVLSKDTYVNDLLSDFDKINDTTHSINEKLEKIIIGKKELNGVNEGSNGSQQQGQNDDWVMFRELLTTNGCPNEISYDKLQQWVERAHSSCLALANTLRSAKEGVECLNKIISGILIGATFILWLLLSQMAKHNVLVLITSPLLAGTFIFGETLKNLFQGIIFIYVLHRFDIGDLCVVDG